MPLIKCPECGKEFSSFADKCPSCGYPTDMLKADLEAKEREEQITKQQQEERRKYLRTKRRKNFKKIALTLLVIAGLASAAYYYFVIKPERDRIAVLDAVYGERYILYATWFFNNNIDSSAPRYSCPYEFDETFTSRFIARCNLSEFDCGDFVHDSQDIYAPDPLPTIARLPGYKYVYHVANGRHSEKSFDKYIVMAKQDGKWKIDNFYGSPYYGCEKISPIFDYSSELAFINFSGMECVEERSVTEEDLALSNKKLDVYPQYPLILNPNDYGTY